MIEVHWSWLVFAAVIEAIFFFILGALDGVEKEVEVYTPEMDAEWAEYVRAMENRNALR